MENFCRNCGTRPCMPGFELGLCLICHRTISSAFQKDIPKWYPNNIGNSNAVCSICLASPDFFEISENLTMYACRNCRQPGKNSMPMASEELYKVAKNIKLIENRTNLPVQFENYRKAIKEQFQSARTLISEHSHDLTIAIETIYKTSAKNLKTRENEFTQKCEEINIINDLKSVNFIKSVSEGISNLFTAKFITFEDFEKIVENTINMRFGRLLFEKEFCFVSKGTLNLMSLEDVKSSSQVFFSDLLDQCRFQVVGTGEVFFYLENQDNCFLFNLEAKDWIKIEKITERKRPGISSVDKEVFLFGGGTKKSEKFDLQSRKWKEISNLPFKGVGVSAIFFEKKIKLVNFYESYQLDYDILTNTYRKTTENFADHSEKMLLASEDLEFCLCDTKIMVRELEKSKWKRIGSYKTKGDFWTNNGFTYKSPYIYFSKPNGEIFRLNTSKAKIEKISPELSTLKNDLKNSKTLGN